MGNHRRKNKKTEFSPVNSVNSDQTLLGSASNSPDRTLESDETVKNGDFSVEEESRRAEDEPEIDDLGLDLSPVIPVYSSNWADSWTAAITDDSDTLDLQWIIASDHGTSSSAWMDWPILEVKPISSFKPECDFLRDEETEPECDFLRDEETEAQTSIVPIENQSIKLGAGLTNLGNTCFLNAVLQSFMHTVPLLQLLASNDHSSPCDSYFNGFCVICVTRELLDFSLASSGGSVSPLKLVNNLSYFSSSFHRYQQEDAHEFLQCFLDKLESRCNDSMPKDRAPLESDNIVKQAFGGRLVSRLRCCNCGHSSDTYEPFIDLSLEIKDVDCLPAALDCFTRVEKIDDPEIKFSCEKCKTQVSMEKQLMLYKAPSVAAFHLKRFENDGSFVKKVDKFVSFPLDLSLLPYTDHSQINNEEMVYDLYAVIVHRGISSCSGHYYSFIRSAPNEWYKFDDSEVFWVHKDIVLTEEAYIMFYAKRGTPWFSDFIVTQKPFIDPPIIYTPESVLDNADAISITSPCIRNTHASDVSESNKTADASSPKPELNKIEDNESKETVQTSSPGPAGPINSSDSHADGVVEEASLPLMHKENNATQDVSVAERTATFIPKTPSRSPSPEISRYDPPEDDDAISDGHITLADEVSGENQLRMDQEQDLERKRGSQSESPLNKKRTKTEVSPSSDDRSPAGGPRSSFGSGLHAVAASSSR
ncbi:Ubiquitin carboxyl-terminal hydrolase 21 [Datura stramonium]|uniref:Ubiquitin carboxyl-terminal hydrolase n=1 Tax=Datura stramonium TaxID=4076 RepID=A0ABS8V6K9_DATST|nr:Ubiquitin carboxyl-terminal hydrolase 21 [Datura stramonium]